MDYEEKSGDNLQERLEELRSELEEHKGFIQTYMLDPHPDFRPAEEERIREISRLADELISMLKDSRDREEEEKETLDEDLNLEYKTHVLGNPDDSEDADNIEGDWTIDADEMIPISEADIPEAERLISAKGKKGKKGKKKKDKKDKKNRKKSKK